MLYCASIPVIPLPDGRSVFTGLANEANVDLFAPQRRFSRSGVLVDLCKARRSLVDALDDLGRYGHRRWILDATGMAVGAFLSTSPMPTAQADRWRNAQAGSRFFGWTST